MLTPADRMAMLDIRYGVRVTLTADGRHLDVAGPSIIVEAAEPMLRHFRADLVRHLASPSVELGRAAR